jgi:Prenyltransferase and squalene oxidase repeat
LGFQEANAVTDQPAKLDKNMPITVSPENEIQLRRSNAEAISAALDWLAGRCDDTHWSDFTMLDRARDVWVTAHVVARLGELPVDCITVLLRPQLEAALNWLEKARVSGSGWSSSASHEADAFTTAWAILALRAHGRAVPRSAMDMLLRCRQANGGFSACAHGVSVQGGQNLSTTEVTVTALRALSMCDSAAEDFLASRLRTELPTTASGRASRLYVCSEILDWETGLAPWALLSRASQCTAQFDLEKPYEQALLLRSLLRLRNQRAWPASAALRDMQLIDGSWPACSVVGPVAHISSSGNPASFADTRVVSTITALTALVMSESQPGLYFGSDLPRPRRFQES